MRVYAIITENHKKLFFLNILMLQWQFIEDNYNYKKFNMNNFSFKAPLKFLHSITASVGMFIRMNLHYIEFCILLAFWVTDLIVTSLEAKNWFTGKNSIYKFLLFAFLSTLVFLATGLGCLVGVGIFCAAAPFIFCIIYAVRAVMDSLEAKGELLLANEGEELLREWDNDSSSPEVIAKAKTYLSHTALSAGYDWLKTKLESVWGMKWLFNKLDSFEQKMEEHRQSFRSAVSKKWEGFKEYWRSETYHPLEDNSSEQNAADVETQSLEVDAFIAEPENKKVVRRAIEMKQNVHAKNIKHKVFDVALSLALIPTTVFLFHVATVGTLVLSCVMYSISSLWCIGLANSAALIGKEKSYLKLAQKETEEHECSQEYSLARKNQTGS